MRSHLRINNSILDALKMLFKKHVVNSNNLFKVKIHTSDSDQNVLFQIKHSITRQSIRFVILVEPTNGVRALLYLRDRNPNTPEFFDNFFTVKDIIEIIDDDDLVTAFLTAIKFLESESSFNKVSFEKIKTCKKISELNGDNILMRVIKSIETHSDYVRLNFAEAELFFAYDGNELYRNIRLPAPGDFFFTNGGNKFQTYSKTRAIHHFELN